METVYLLGGFNQHDQLHAKP